MSWKDVYDALKEVFHYEIPKDPKVVILGVIPEGFKRRAKSYLLQILLRPPLKPDPPSYITVWIPKVWEHEMEQII